MLCLVLCSGQGCVYTRVVKDGWAPLRALGGASSPSPSKANRTPHGRLADRSSWAILIASFEGDRRQRQAERLIKRLRQEAHLPDLWLENGPDQTHVYRGRYSDPGGVDATEALRQTRMVQLGDTRPYTSASLIPLGPQARGGADPLDLRRHTGMLSLQIGFYDDAFGRGYREAAQEAARELRAQGEEAYYYRGPHRSMVTIGLFTEDDFVQQGVQSVYGPRIKELQARFPYNLGNGRTLIEKIQGKHVGEQPSFLVRVN